MSRQVSSGPTERCGLTRDHEDESQAWHAKLASGAGMVSASIGNDFHCGNRGMARNVRGAKKFVRSRVRLDRKRHIQRQLEE